MHEIVVCTHGIWMKGWVMRPISHHLSQQGHECMQFSYHSLRRTPLQNAIRLAKYVDRLEADIVHFVGHSYGGIILLHYFEMFTNLRPGRVVLLGTPLTGSSVARFVSSNNYIKNSILGQSAKSLHGHVPTWKGIRPLAIIAGTHGIGIGQLLGAPLDKPNDGTVAVSETKLENCTIHIQVPYSHTGMLLAKSVAIKVDEFLRTGNVT